MQRPHGAIDPRIEVRAIDADHWTLWRGLRLDALREAPYAFNSTLAQWQGDGDAEERWRERLRAVPFNLVGLLDGTPAGIASGTALDPARTVELISLWVAPFARGRGVGDALLAGVIGWARTQAALTVALAVFSSNARARSLYLRHGFVDVDTDPATAVGAGSCDRRMTLDLQR